MVPDEIDPPRAVVRVLEGAGIESVFGIPGGDGGFAMTMNALEDAPFWQVQSPFAKEGAGGE